MKIKKLIFLSVTFLPILFLASCSSAKLEMSSWKTENINIDGNANEWKTNLKQVGDQKVWLATSNDDKFLYMCLVVEDRAKIMQMMRAGFITWFIPTQNDESAFGIKYPLSNKIMPKEDSQKMTRDMFQQDGGIEKMVAMVLDKQEEFQILNKEKYSLSLLPLGNNDGIKAKLGYSEGKLVYELQVPLAVHEDYTYQIACVPGEDVKIKFETEAIDMSAMRSGGRDAGTSEGMSPGGQGGMRRGGGPGGGMRRGGGMGGFTMPEPFNYTTEIKLALPK